MKALSSMATRHVLADLGELALAAGHPPIEIESVGGVDAATRVAAGEWVDLVFLALGALQKLAADGHVDPATVTPLLGSQVAVAVPTDGVDAAAWDGGAAFAGPDQLQAALLSAANVGYSTGPSGTALLRQISGWGLDAALAGRLVQARPGIPVARLLAEREVSLGFQQLSELVGQPGIRILGVMPLGCEIDTVFAGAVAACATDPSRASEVLSLYASKAATSRIEQHSFTPLWAS